MTVKDLDDEELGKLLIRELEEDEICLLLNQAKEYRDETLLAIRLRKGDPYSCPDCYNYFDPSVWTHEGDNVCTGCGLVLDIHRAVASYADVHRTRRRCTYPVTSTFSILTSAWLIWAATTPPYRTIFSPLLNWLTGACVRSGEEPIPSGMTTSGEFSDL
jgi:hypothetical protein